MSAEPRHPTLFIETDIQQDVDDLGALALAIVLEQQGRIRIAGVGVNTSSLWGAQAIETLKTAYGAEFPVGIVTPSTLDVVETDYVRLISAAVTPEESAWPTAVELLARTLAEAEPHSVTVVSIGFFANLCALLELSGDFGRGEQLVREKVARTVVMGGIFPSGREFNFVEDAAATDEFLRKWPTPIEFIGQEVGNDVITGRGLARDLGPEHPLAVAYESYCGSGAGRPSWDPMSVYLASRPDWPALSWSPPGTVRIRLSDGHNEWSPDPDGLHRYASLAVSPDEIAAELDAIMSQRGGRADH